jgi:septal ring factor EnvC (AmiA/AmiB activator)
MPDAWNAAKIREFEHVLAAPTVALLRVSAKPARRRSVVGPRPVLLADDGQAIRRFAAIPSPPDDRGVLRAAYSVSADLVAPNTAFSLELADGSILALPAPQPGEARLAREPDVEASAESADTTERPGGSDERRSDLVSKLTELSARLAESEQARDELEHSVPQLREAGERTEHELAEARERALRAEAEAEKAAAALQELDVWRGELERRLTETTDELSAVKHARTQEEDELRRLGGELAEAGAKVELLEAQVKTLDDQLTDAEDRRDAPVVDEMPAVPPYSSSERESLARQAGQLAALLANAERFSELAHELAEARAQAETLHVAASAEPASQAAGDDIALALAREEIEDLRAALAQARDAETQLRIEAVRHAAETEARELAERELAQAASVDG